MNDDDLSELILCASAYLDGELDADEMARAEADPAVMAEVDVLSALQFEIRDVPAVSGTVRDAVLAAALAEFDLIHTGAVTPVSAPAPARVVPFRPRPSYARWLTAAAAVVAVGVLGVVIANGAGGGDDDEAGNAAFDQPASAPDADSARSAEATAESAFIDGSAAEESAPAADVAAAAEMAPATEAPSEAPTELAVEAAPASPPFDPTRPIADESELGATGVELVTMRDAGMLPPTPNTSCVLAPFEELSLGLYRAADGVRDVLIAVDPATQQTAAFDIDTCDLVAESPLP